MAEATDVAATPDPSRIVPPAAAPTAPRLRLRLLGRMEALDPQGRSVLPRVRKTRATLAVLAMAGGEPVMRQHITSLLWSTRDREQARGSLRQSVHELVDSLGPGLLVADRNHLQLRGEDFDSDLRAVTRATPIRPEALDLLHGAPLLEDLVGLDPAFDRWLSIERRKLAAGAAAVAEAVLAARIAEHAAPGVILAAAQAVLAVDKLRESAWRASMTAYMAMGERAGAMDAFERCCATLAELARTAPSAETKALYDTIRAEPIATGANGTAANGTASGRHSSRGVRLGVMPFRVLGESGNDGLSFGLADEITNALSRFRWIFLIASPSLAAIHAAGPDSRLRSLGLDFLLEGTVQRGGDRIRVTVRLLDMNSVPGAQRMAAEGGEVVWARRFDRADGDLFSLQDEVAAETVAQIDPELLLREAHRATARPPNDPTAYELMLRAVPALYRLEEAGFRAAGVLLQAATARDPRYAPAWAWLAYWHVFLVGQGWAADPADAMAAAGNCAERAVTLAPSDARALTIAGHVRAFLDHQLADAIELHERALELNPNLPLAWVFCGLALAYAGRHDEAIQRIEEGRRLSPFDPHGFFFDTALMVPTLMRRQFDAVVELGRRAAHLNPTLSTTLKGYLSALGHLGPSAEMLSIRARLLELEPGFCVQRALARSPLQREADRALYADGLRRAGLPEAADGPEPGIVASPPGFGLGLAIP
jgi:DNA-binding SARP family transcriptional activator